MSSSQVPSVPNPRVEPPSPFPGALKAECPLCFGDLYRDRDPEYPNLPRGKWKHVGRSCSSRWRLIVATMLLILGVGLAVDPRWYFQLPGFIMLMFVPALLFDAVMRVVILRTTRLAGHHLGPNEGHDVVAADPGGAPPRP